MRHGVEHLVGSPYDLQGMYTEEVMGDPQFAAWSQKRIRVHSAVERIVKDGVASGVFLPIDTVLGIGNIWRVARNWPTTTCSPSPPPLRLRRREPLVPSGVAGQVGGNGDS
jgi:hypothetical protein